VTGSAQIVSPSIRWAELTRPNEALAAFTVTWHDSVNRAGFLEPVGTHPDHRHRGLGKAVVLHAMHQMRAAGMTHATVANTGTDEASRALYEACGMTGVGALFSNS
jgi:ribosomal protein S18 acetylase RimI-like enzyme